MVIKEDEIKKIITLVKKYNIYLISDEIYSAITFDSFSFGKYFEEIKEQLIVAQRLFKITFYDIYRLGFVLLNEDLQLQVKKVSQYTIASPSTLSQYAAITAIDENIDTTERTKIYQRRIEYFYKELERIGFDVLQPGQLRSTFLPLTKI